MRMILPLLLVATFLLATSCMPIQPETAAGEVVTLYVGSELVDCVGVGPLKCMQVKYSPDGEWEYFYDTIAGFDYEEGYEYELIVQIDPVANPPADGSSYTYTLVELVDKQPATE